MGLLASRDVADTDKELFALSDNLIFGKTHAAPDSHSLLIDHTFGFQDNACHTSQPSNEQDADHFGEKPFLNYTYRPLNRRVGARKRNGKVNFGHSLSCTVTLEALTNFPPPALRSAS